MLHEHVNDYITLLIILVVVFVFNFINNKTNHFKAKTLSTEKIATGAQVDNVTKQ